MHLRSLSVGKSSQISLLSFSPLQSSGHFSHLSNRGEWELGRGDEVRFASSQLHLWTGIYELAFMKYVYFLLAGKYINGSSRCLGGLSQVFSYPRFAPAASSLAPQLLPPPLGCTQSSSAPHGGTDGKQEWAAFRLHILKPLNFSSALMSRLTFSPDSPLQL